ncbi:hypothetical protein PPL_06800 [Heterostelium album PN500]|uniref:F-box domain-containing protein n=1 Tax=Heterostelium pallidum (strain ATCC 26659 / Pp 5 / PN500) TaxID=670386 RepID=D3BDJ8_HETP5|nr:hypothetical protein PPL_06800 [Heterostelium album PN500]EFA79979.1 hypothetical protein PPL_06800 [Heterostelium album PN500]|eukprot:XP_020432099.1 hypothetical protein PPL_06800 [Heterostelium album PN500]
MGQAISNNLNSTKIINSNQTILPDLIWRLIIEQLSYDQCRNHQHDFNVLSLSLISHYWLVNIVAKSSLKITTLHSKCKFLLNYPKSYHISLKKLNKTTNNNNQRNNNDNRDIKFNIGKFTLIYSDNSITYQWIEQYNDAISSYWSFSSMSVIDLPEIQDIKKLSVASRLRKLRIYCKSNYHIEDWTLLPNLEVLSLRSNSTNNSRPFVLPGRDEPPFQTLRSLTLSINFNNKIPLFSSGNIKDQCFTNIQTLELNHYHAVDWSHGGGDQTPIDINLFPNVKRLKLNHIYHRLIHALSTHPSDEPPSLLAGLTSIRHLSITNSNSKGYKFNVFSPNLLMEYEFTMNLTHKVFKKDIVSIGHRLETLKLKGELSLFRSLLPSIELLVNLRRLSLPTKVSIDTHTIKTLFKLDSLIQLTATFKVVDESTDKINDNDTDFPATTLADTDLQYFIEANRTIKYLKVCQFTKMEHEHSLLMKLLETSHILEDVRFLCVKPTTKTTATTFTVSNKLTVSFMNDNLFKQPKQKTKSDYLPHPINPLDQIVNMSIALTTQIFLKNI